MSQAIGAQEQASHLRGANPAVIVSWRTGTLTLSVEHVDVLNTVVPMAAPGKPCRTRGLPRRPRWTLGLRWQGTPLAARPTPERCPPVPPSVVQVALTDRPRPPLATKLPATENTGRKTTYVQWIGNARKARSLDAPDARNSDPDGNQRGNAGTARTHGVCKSLVSKHGTTVQTFVQVAQASKTASGKPHPGRSRIS